MPKASGGSNDTSIKVTPHSDTSHPARQSGTRKSSRARSGKGRHQMYGAHSIRQQLFPRVVQQLQGKRMKTRGCRSYRNVACSISNKVVLTAAIQHRSIKVPERHPNAADREKIGDTGMHQLKSHDTKQTRVGNRNISRHAHTAWGGIAGE